MAKGLHLGVGEKAHKVKKMYIGIAGKARKVKKAYIGVGGVARLFYSSGAESGLYLLGPNWVLHQVNPDTMAYLIKMVRWPVVLRIRCTIHRWLPAPYGRLTR